MIKYKIYKYMIKDYFIYLNPRNIKKEDLRVLFIYLFCFAESIIVMEVDRGVFFYSYMISAVIGIAFCYLCGKKPSKIFYLLPMSKKERIQYATIGFKIRLIMPQVLYCLWAGVLLLLSRISWQDYLTGFIMLLICNAAIQTASGVVKKDGFMGAFQFFVRIVLFIGFFIYYAIYESKMLGSLSATQMRCLFIIWYVIVTVLLLVMVKYTIQYYKNMIKRAACYEYTN